MCEGSRIEIDDLPFEPVGTLRGPAHVPGATMAAIQRAAIIATLDSVGGSTAKAAELLDISVRTIQYRLHEYSLGHGKDKPDAD